MSAYDKSFVNKIYSEREFLILGLTGRTGSGCSTAANVLSKRNFFDLSLSDVNVLSGNDKRKALIVHNYARANWRPFFVIKMSDVILYFVLRNMSPWNEFAREVSGYGITSESLMSVHDCLTSLSCSGDLLSDFDLAVEMNKSLISKVDRAQYKILFQVFGDNIRASGDPLNFSEDGSKCFALPELVGDLIKARKKERGDCYFVIDAIRNPYEAHYFKQRFSAFYLVAITVDDDARRRRLAKMGYGADDINQIDYKEGLNINDLDIDQAGKEAVKKKTQRVGNLYSQNISACLECADILIGNPNDGGGVFSNPRPLADSLIKFYALMRKPGLVTPSAVERCMQMAFMAKYNSGCLSRQVGAVVTTEDYSVLSVGWNDVAKGQVSCNLRNVSYYGHGHDEIAYSSFELGDEKFSGHIKTKYAKVVVNEVQRSGRTVSYCFKDEYNGLTGKSNQVFTRALHAEENAFLQVAKRGGMAVQGGILFTTASPCELCAKKAYQLGMEKIYYVDPYPGIAQKLFLQCGSNRPDLILFSGAIGRAYDQLYRPLMPYKDELKSLI